MSKVTSSLSATIYDFCPIGAIIPFPASAIPNGWLECNGQAVSRSTFKELFSLIGTTYGAGDGSATFNLPDYRGAFLRGLDNGKGYDTDRTLGSYEEDMFQSHWHQAGYGSGGSSGYIITGYVSMTGTGAATETPISDGVNGMPRYGAETRPKNVSVLYCIKATMAIVALASTVSTYAPLTHTTHNGEAALHGTNGYKKFADGTIIQWGMASGTFTGGTPLSITLPIAFPNSCSNAVATFNMGTNFSVVQAVLTSRAVLSIYQNVSQATTVCWQAVGY